MGGAAQRDCARCEAGGGASRYWQQLRDRSVGRDSVRGIVVRDGIEPGRDERRRRDRARCHRICARRERRRDRDRKHPAIIHRELITTLAARHRLPAVYAFRYFVTVGGLISYGPDSIDPFRRAAGYVDRVLKGEKPADLPVQAPTKYET